MKKKRLLDYTASDLSNPKTLGFFVLFVLALIVSVVALAVWINTDLKPLVSKSAAEVPGGCIDFYLTGEPWSSDITIEEFRQGRFVELGKLGGTWQPHSMRSAVGAGQHHLRIGYSYYEGSEFRREVHVEVGQSNGRRIRIHNESAGHEMTGIRSATIFMKFFVIEE